MGFSLSNFRISNMIRRPAMDRAGTTDLKRVLGPLDLIGYGLASTVGAGIFVVTGVVAKQKAGPAILLSFVFSAVASLFSAFCYSEFAARIPVSGSAYTFAYVTLGELMGWFIGWNLTLEYAISAAAVARGWAGYVVSFFSAVGVSVPDWLSSVNLNFLFNISILSAVIVVACSAILLFGVQESARFNNIMTCLNVAIILFIVILGSLHVDTSNWDNFFPFGVSGAFQGAGTVFFSYIGFDSVTTLAGESRKPARDLPLGIIGTLTIATSLYCAVSLVVTGMVNFHHLSTTSPLSSAFKSVGLDWAAIIVAVGSVTTMTVTTLTSLLGQSRIFYQMAQDGLLWTSFGWVSKRKVPWFGTVITGVAAGIIALVFDLDVLTNMISVGTLMAFGVVCSGVLVLRYKDEARPYKVPSLVTAYIVTAFLFAASFTFHWPIYAHVITALPMLGILLYFVIFGKQVDIPETFRCPLVPFTPCLGMVCNVYLIMQLPLDSLYRLVVWTVVGMLIYFFYGIHHSKLNKAGYTPVGGDDDEEQRDAIAPKSFDYPTAPTYGSTNTSPPTSQRW